MRRLRSILACAASAAIVAAGATSALADDIYNNLDTSIDATAEVMALNVGGPNGTTTLAVRETNGDGKNGCNFQGQSPFVAKVVSSAPAVATVSPEQVTFTTCGSTISLTVKALAEGSTTITLQEVSNSTAGTIDVAPATFTVNVAAPAPADEAPTLTISGPERGASYVYGQVPDATCNVSDKEDGEKAFPATLSGGDNGIGEITASCSYTDGGQHTVTSSVTYTVEKADAAVTVTCDPASVEYTGVANDICSARVTGVDLDEELLVTYDDNINAGAVTATAAFAEDAHHNAATGTGTFTITQATPSVSVACDDVTYDGTAQEPCSASVTGVNGTQISDGTITWEYGNNIDANDAASAVARWGGNRNYISASGSGTFKIAKAASTVTLSCPESVWFTGSPIEPCSATVSGAGVVTGTAVIKYDNNKLAGTAAATATYAGDDNHDAAAPVSTTFTIKGFDLSGFYKPVDMGMLNTVKAGSTVPLKFEVFLNGVERTDTTAIQGFSVRTLSCTTAAVLEEAPIEMTSTGGTSLRYDTTGGQFIQNWQTPKVAGACYRVTMTTIDGNGLSADFKLK